MSKLRVLLALITQENDYQREQASVAKATAERLGVELEVIYANGDAIGQTKQILAAIQPSAANRPAAVLVEPVGTGMSQVAKVAAHANIGWVLLNRDKECLLPLAERSAAPTGCVENDSVEMGRIQGRQLAVLLPNGGKVLYVQGPGSDVSKQRRAGLDETLPATITLQTVRGKWTEESGYEAMAALLKIQGARAPGIDVVVSQNDAMAMGARKAVEALTAPEHRAAWLAVPFTGCDGVPATGQRWVQEGLLAATVVTPALTGTALELLIKALETGKPMAERTLTTPTSYPRLEQLKPVAQLAGR